MIHALPGLPPKLHDTLCQDDYITYSTLHLKWRTVGCGTGLLQLVLQDLTDEGWTVWQITRVGEIVAYRYDPKAPDAD